MKITTLAILAAALEVGASAWPIIPASAPVVTVCLGRAADGLPDDMVRNEASRIFSAIPVRIVWQSEDACEVNDAIRVHLRGQTPSTLMPGALAFARPYQGTYIEIFYDRVRAMALPDDRRRLLAYVLVHEITHILQGACRHSEAGIMKANWRDHDFAEMRYGDLKFTAEDVRLVQEGLKTRAQRLEALGDTLKSR
ncbi:MAG TPA: hypothetical protein VH639_03690 [Bryobacteraceae bacterium]|jgi:hypothetical protein